MKILFATAELRPLVSTGGLGEAAAGLTAALRDRGDDVLTVLPAYRYWPLEAEQTLRLEVPDWVGPATVRIGNHPSAGRLALVEAADIERPDPYVDESGVGWPDNDARFARFAACVAALAHAEPADVVHLNDWHTALAPAFLGDGVPTVLTIHNLQHQGWTDIGWLHHLPTGRNAYVRNDAVNMLAGGIALADRVVAVSPNYAREITEQKHGFELDDVLRSRGDDLRGIVNGIDTRSWNPATDEFAPRYDADSLDDKALARAQLLAHAGWEDDGRPLLVMVTRLVDQKGVELALDVGRFLDRMGARLLVLGSGDIELADRLRSLHESMPDSVWFRDGYDLALSHDLFAGGDLLLMPSRFEPCGLAQMQAMAYGTIPIVTPVGGLVDTVVDADQDRANGTGFVADGVDAAAVVDAVHRALRALRHAGRRRSLQRRGMAADWSWAGPAEQFAALYREIT